MHTPCGETTAQNTDSAGILVDSLLYTNANASRRRHIAERVGLPTLGGSGVAGKCPGEETVRNDYQKGEIRRKRRIG
ncbi:MAG: hypothetical protein ABJL67_24935 [Sulfitobacter sp.]